MGVGAGGGEGNKSMFRSLQREIHPLSNKVKINS